MFPVFTSYIAHNKNESSWRTVLWLHFMKAEQQF